MRQWSRNVFTEFITMKLSEKNRSLLPLSHTKKNPQKKGTTQYHTPAVLTNVYNELQSGQSDDIYDVYAG